MIILALDISTKSTGAAVFNDTQLIHYECLVASSQNVFNRIDKITEGIQKIIQQYKIQKVIAETPLPAFVGKNISTYEKLTFAHGIIGDMLNKHKLKYDVKYIPGEWRKKVGIQTGPKVKRSQLKQQDIQLVKQLYHIDVNDDVADAILIGRAYTQQNCNEINWE